MADLWIQVETSFPRSKLVDAAVRELGLDRDQAMGKLVRLWLAVMEDRRGGNLGDRTDDWIEEEVNWRGERGAFARFIRAYHLDEHGMIRDWPEKYGRLDRQREQYRTKKQAQRGAARGQGGVAVPETVSGTSQGTTTEKRGGVPTDVPQNASNTLSVSQSLSSYRETEKSVENPKERETDPLADVLAQAGLDLSGFEPGDRAVIEGALRSSSAPVARAVVLAKTLTEHAPAIVGRAMREYMASEQPWSTRLFGGFVRDAERASKLDRGREALKRETQHIDREAIERERAAREEAEMERVAAAFERDEPERFAELKAQAEKQVKHTGMMRDVMVRGALLSLIRKEVSHAA